VVSENRQLRHKKLGFGNWQSLKNLGFGFLDTTTTLLLQTNQINLQNVTLSLNNKISGIADI